MDDPLQDDTEQFKLSLGDRESQAIYGMIREGRYSEANAAIRSAWSELEHVEKTGGWSRVPPLEMRSRLASLRTLLVRLRK